MQTLNVDDVSETLADEGLYPASKGHRNPSAPNFVFFDDDRELNPLEAYTRETALDFEEWVATQNHHEALDARKEERAMITRQAPPEAWHGGPCHSRLETQSCGYTPVPSYAELKRAQYLVRGQGLPPSPTDHLSRAARKRVAQVIAGVAATPDGYGGLIRSIHDDFDLQVDEAAMFELCEYANLKQVVDDAYNLAHPEYGDDGTLLNPHKGLELRKTISKPVTKAELEDAQRLNNWLVALHKHRPRTNDHWHTALARMINAVPLDDTTTVQQIVKVKKLLAELVNYAPGPVGSTVFRNPDGSRHETNGTDFGRAKETYITRHKISKEFVSVDRVQIVGKKKSKLVVGLRKTSDSVPSNYFDRDPVMAESKIAGEWTDAYVPHACALHRVPPNLCMPDGSHRLTVREFERAIIAGADLYEDDEDAFAASMEETYLPDSRVMVLNMGYGCDARDRSALTHEEDYLYGVLQMFGEGEACELILLEKQEPGILKSHFTSNGDYVDAVHSILNFVSQDDNAMLPYVISILSQRPVADTNAHADAKSVSRSNKQALSKAADAVDYGFQALIGNDTPG